MREAQRGPAPSQPWANWGEKRTQRQEMKTGILVHSGRCDKKKHRPGIVDNTRLFLTVLTEASARPGPGEHPSWLADLIF